MTTALGLDIGGANLKSADLAGNVRSIPFPMWTQHRELADVLPSMSATAAPNLVGLTMTAELADCFDSKGAGVKWVIDCVRQAFPKSAVRVWLTTGEFAEPDDAADLPELVAAANWHALATWAGRAVPDGPAILMDIGSTTTDLIPLLDGTPLPTGLTDVERLRSAELVYTGVRRTPLCAVRQSIVLNNSHIPLAAELFATTLDVYLLQGVVNEDPDSSDTADGAPATIEHAHRRIARMTCCDTSELSLTTAREIARQFAATQQQQLMEALSRVLAVQHDRLTTVGRADESPQMILSGSGGFLAQRVATQCGLNDVVSLRDSGSFEIAEAACAFAMARLVFERCRDDLLESVPFTS